MPEQLEDRVALLEAEVAYMNWKSYEEVAAHLLDYFADKFDLDRVEGKQKIKGRRSGTEWEIDAKGVCCESEGFMIIECRRYTTSKQNQEQIGSLAYRIIDTGAVGGIIVSPCGIQTGAAKVASAEKILEVKLDSNSTPTDFALGFLGKMMFGAGIELKSNLEMNCSAEVFRACKICGERFCVENNEKLCRNCKPKIAT